MVLYLHHLCTILISKCTKTYFWPGCAKMHREVYSAPGTPRMDSEAGLERVGRESMLRQGRGVKKSSSVGKRKRKYYIEMLGMPLPCVKPVTHWPILMTDIVSPQNRRRT